MKYQLKIKPDGTMEFLGAPPPGFPVHRATRSRFSEIVPVSKHLRLWFRILRWLFGETGRVSERTRKWVCLWECTILRGPHRGQWMRCWDRDVLVRWEKQLWKKTNRNVCDSKSKNS